MSDRGGAYFEAIRHVPMSQPLDCCEICPHVPGLLIAGSYLLQEPEQRVGQLYLFMRAHLLQTLDLRAAVLDVKWQNCGHVTGNRMLVGVASTQMRVYIVGVSLDTHTEKWTMSVSHVCHLSECATTTTSYNSSSPSLCLSLCWSDVTANQLCVSDSMGGVAIIDVSPSSVSVLLYARLSQMEMWTCCYDNTLSCTVYCGSDDAMIRRMDTRDSSSQHTVARSGRRAGSSHESGVCSLASHPACMLSGGYDQTLLLWDRRYLQEPQGRVGDLGGGVWRIKTHPALCDSVLLGCMTGGVSVVSLREAGPCLRLPPSCHRSLVYGVDWAHRVEADDTCLAVSCSFYDCKMCVWHLASAHTLIAALPKQMAV